MFTYRDDLLQEVLVLDIQSSGTMGHLASNSTELKHLKHMERTYSHSAARRADIGLLLLVLLCIGNVMIKNY